MSSPKTASTKVLDEVHKLAPSVTLKADTTFYWSPKTQTIAYKQTALNDIEGIWSLLHETAHAILEHHTYTTDFELLQLEVAAWEQAKQLAAKLELDVNENYVQDCLDTYRDWLHRRSTCPTCGSVGLQHSAAEYRCHNCHTTWHVSAARFCRPYRRKETTAKEKSPDSLKNQTTFR